MGLKMPAWFVLGEDREGKRKERGREGERERGK